VNANDDRSDGYIDFARAVIRPDSTPGSFHARQVLDAASGYRIALQVGHDRSTQEYLEKLRDLIN
jgi:hypothetical protein